MNLGRIPAKTALLDPGREALIDIPNDRRMTFGTLDERVRRLANGFCDGLNLKKGDRVAILSKNCIQYMEVFYACARCGLGDQPAAGAGVEHFHILDAVLRKDGDPIPLLEV